jgi:translation initiation factor 1
MGKEKNLSWDDFVKLGNPDNAPDIKEEKIEDLSYRKHVQVRLHYEKKGRGGKEAVIIRGLDEIPEVLKEICKKLKTKIGVGGSVKGNEIIMQGKQRDKMLMIIKDLGFTSVKNSGG